jgi:hypothetical protein
MTPKEKAIELVEDMHNAPETGYNEHAKECALIAVDEILNHHSQEQSLYRIDTYYWVEVKKEIETL